MKNKFQLHVKTSGSIGSKLQNVKCPRFHLTRVDKYLHK